MSSYNLFPGLKQILEDKRIRHFGISGDSEKYQDYLMAEQFVLDMRNISAADTIQMIEIYKDLQELHLDNLPYEHNVIHVVENFGKDMEWNDIPKYEGIITVFYHKKQVFMLYETAKGLIEAVEKVSSDEKAKKEFDDIVKLIKLKLVVMLATRNSIKDRHEIKDSQKSHNHIPHKKGSGGYTIIRPPEAYEIEEGTHASLRPHLRRGHIRKLHPTEKTKWIWVKSCFVNGIPETQRISYLTHSDESITSIQ